MQEIKEQIIKAKQGDKEAFDALVTGNSGLVYAVSRRFYHRGCETEDIIQIGMIGLMKAIRRFDTNYDVEFSTYAVPMIIGEIKRFLRDDGMIKVSRNIRENGVKVARCKEQLSQELGRNPKLTEIAQCVGLRDEDVQLALEAGSEVESIYKTVNSGVDEENYLIDQLKSDINREEETFTSLFVSLEVEQLEEKERDLIQMRYFQDMTQSEVAKRMHISQVTVSRMEKKILKSLRQKMES